MSDWGEVSKALSMSQMTLEAIWNKDEKNLQLSLNFNIINDDIIIKYIEYQSTG